MLDLITDRAQSDVESLKSLIKKIQNGTATAAEITSFLTEPHKGSYNYADYNRVGEAVEYLADLLNAYGYSVSVTAKTDWTAGEEIDLTARSAYITDIQTLKDAFYGITSIPSEWAFINYSQANAIERLLLEIEENITNMEASFKYCGLALCGEV